MSEEDPWECYPKGRGTECRRRRTSRYQNGYNAPKRDVYFGNNNYKLKEFINPETDFDSWHKYDYTYHFSTHDWLTYFTLKTIMETPYLKEMWDGLENNFWTNKVWIHPKTNKPMTRVELCLYGSAAPDYPYLIKYEGITIKLPCLDLVRFRDHRIIDKVDYIHYKKKEYQSGKVIEKYLPFYDHPYKNPIERCNNILLNIRSDLKYVRRGGITEKEKAIAMNKLVFQMGIISHFIGDCACFPHLFDYMNDAEFLEILNIKRNNVGQFEKEELKTIHTAWDYVHKNFQWLISERTDGRRGTPNRPQNIKLSENSLVLNDFFTINIDYNSISPTDPYNAAYKTAQFTYYGQNDFETSTNYMFTHYDIVGKDWSNFRSDWETSQQERLRKFMKKVQDCLQMAIINICNSFIYIAQQI